MATPQHTNPDLARWIEKIDRQPSGCWVWRGTCGNGRPQFWFPIGKHRRRIAAHRFSWLTFKGEIPEGQLIRTTCDNDLCVNPKHLTLTKPERAHCKNAHDLSITGYVTNERLCCKECRRNRQAAWYARNGGAR